MALVTGSELQNRYQIEQLLGLGGMGAVYRAYDTHRHQVVAIKENVGIAPGVVPDVLEARRRQFEREVAMVARLHHPNIPGVIDHFVTPDGNQYLVMDFVEGEDLAQIIRRNGPVSEANALAWISQVCNALGYLHSQTPPVIHRDIKPQNIKLTPEGKVFLVDFGIAKVGGGDSLTTKGALSVTPGFSPPEQYAMTGTDVRSDVYSLGATLYALLTGQVPPDSISLQSGDLQLVPPRRVNANISSTVQQAVLKAMETRRSDRPHTVDEFWRMLNAGSRDPEAETRALAGGDLIKAMGIRRIVGVMAKGPYNLRLILLGVVAAVVLIIALVSSFSKSPSQRTRSNAAVPTPAIQTPLIATATETAATPTPSPVAVATIAEIALLTTQVAPVRTVVPLVVPTEMDDASIMATQQALNARSTRQMASFQDCDRIDFEILQSPMGVQVVAAAVTNVKLTWRVRNEATSLNCHWGQAGEEIQILRAVLVGAPTDIGAPVKLNWIQNNEYDLSLNVQLGPGSYTLGWRLLLPNKKVPDGRQLEARISVVQLSPTPAPTPTPTPCPVITYECQCTLRCVGRTCIRVCEECTRERCD